MGAGVLEHNDGLSGGGGATEHKCGLMGEGGSYITTRWVNRWRGGATEHKYGLTGGGGTTNEEVDYGVEVRVQHIGMS